MIQMAPYFKSLDFYEVPQLTAHHTIVWKLIGTPSDSFCYLWLMLSQLAAFPDSE